MSTNNTDTGTQSAVPVWTLESHNDTGPSGEGFWEWWEVTDGSRTFKCHSEADALFLQAALTAFTQAPTAFLLEGTQLVEFGQQPYHAGSEWTPLYALQDQRREAPPQK